MLDFTSAVYLGWRHGSADLAGWDRLTTGRPAAVQEPSAARAVAARIAATQGAAAGVVHRSASHALTDALDLAVGPGSAVFVDRGAYALADDAATRTSRSDVRVIRYDHHDAVDLARRLASIRPAARGVVVVTDGWCVSCSRPAPLAALGSISRRCNGTLVVDDSQAIGVLGAAPRRRHPLGEGGGGTFRWLGVPPRSAVLVASLAKAYGAPLTVTTGPAPLIDTLRGAGSRWHSSPPTAADFAAARAAVHDEAGNRRRRSHLAVLVLRLREGLRRLGLGVLGWPFPLVSVALRGADAAGAMYETLLGCGVRALPLHRRCREGAALAFALTARHTPADVDAVLDITWAACKRRTPVTVS